MLKKFLFNLTLTIISVFLLYSNAFAYIHKLRNGWYNEDIAGTEKQHVTSITFENETYNKDRGKIYWELDQDGLIAYMDSDTDVVIAIPEDDTLETSFNSNDLFAFYVFNDLSKRDYETGDNGQKVYGVTPDDGSIPIKEEYSKYESDLEEINNLYLLDTYPTEHFDNFFKGLKNLVSVDVSSMNTRFAKTFHCMFMGCEKLKEINMNNFNVENVEDMSDMFRDCKSLVKVRLNNLKTNKLKTMSSMFENCHSIKTLNLNSFNTKNVEDMSYMFKNCFHLETLYIDKFDTGEVRNFEAMFDNCRSLKYLDTSNFNTKSAGHCNQMFIDCQSLEALDLRGFTFTGNVETYSLLTSCSSLKAILISDPVAKRIYGLGLEGKWKNITTNKIYDFDNGSFEQPVAGGYVKV